MIQNKYILLLNNTLKEYILTLNSRGKGRLREKFEFLENGIWDTGVRVKKLRGVSEKVIFEARLSKGDRIIFTLGKHKKNTAIYVWGIVKHDDISSSAQKILPANVPFLSFDPETREEFPDISIDDLPDSYFSQENIEEKSPDDYGPQKWLVLTDEEWKRLLLTADPGSFEIYLFLTSEQEDVLKTDPPVLLSGTAGSGKTTISVYYLLKKEFKDKKKIFITYSPFLKQFSERIYNGLVKNTGHEKTDKSPDFYVFRDLLRDIMKANNKEYDEKKEAGLREFENIFQNHKLYKKYDTELVWEEIRAIIKGAKPPISVNRYRELVLKCTAGVLSRNNLHELTGYLYGLKNYEFINKIESIIDRKSSFSSFEDFVLNLGKPDTGFKEKALFILQHILKIIEKKSNNFSNPLLTFKEYTLLGRKRAPNFLYDRAEIYSIAEYYQGRLEEQGLWDEIDICKGAVRLLNTANDKFSYDLVVCDEVQDFSDIQISLIFRLAKNYRDIFLAGDLKQIINPSGFRWEEVKNRFFERGIQVPGVFNLNLNFRCVGNIVKLSNALLDLKQKLIGLSSGEMREEWKFNGKPAFLIYGVEEDEMIEKIQITGTGQIILVRDNYEKVKLKKALHTELIFTINEAKGLEFDTVFFWKFCQDKKSSEIWRKIKKGHHFERNHYPHIKHEINLLYVAITRARNTLIIYDGVLPSEIWDIEVFQDKLYRTAEKEALTEVWQPVSSPAEWEEQGDYFFEREYYPAAVECYRNSGNLIKTEVAQAFAFERNEDYGKAAKLFEKHGYHKRAAENYELIRNYEKALVIWKKLKDDGRTRLCTIRMYEKQGNYNRAAGEWEKLKNYGNALKNWEKAKNHEKIAGYYFFRKQYKKAASRFEQAADYQAAAECYKKVKEYDKAAGLYYKAGDYKNASVLYKRLKNNGRMIQCYESLKDYYNAALLHEKNKDVDNAIKSFRKYTVISEDNRKKLEQEAVKYLSTVRTTLKSAVRYSALSMYEKSAQLFYGKGFYDNAIKEFDKLGNYASLARCYAKLGKYYESALAFEKTDLENKWDEVIDYLMNYIYDNRKNEKKRADRIFKEAGNCFHSGSYDRALARYKAIRFPERIFDTYLKINRDEEALAYFMDEDMEEYVERYIDEKKEIDVSLNYLSSLSEDYFCEDDWHYDKKSDDLDIIARLLSMRLKKHRDKKTVSFISKFISSFDSYYFAFEDRIPDSLFDLVLESKQYNAVFQIISSNIDARKMLPEKILFFLDSVKMAAEGSNDENLYASYYFFYDREKYESVLERLEMTDRNFELFAESSFQYHKAADYMFREGKIERAARVCRSHKDFNMAASIYEKTGNFKAAGKDYRDAKNYSDALRCFQKINDERNIARVYERMKEYRNAIDIWKRLDRPREIMRIEKKMKKEEAKRKQLNLFQ